MSLKINIIRRIHMALTGNDVLPDYNRFGLFKLSNTQLDELDQAIQRLQKERTDA